ncbi:MAG: hypothetical protein J6V72_20770 [Kiritimatiellae bacterium]|nr:hypothetical protein [Kiritimatiellia bacterium]
MSAINHIMFKSVGGGLASWYPRWGTGDMIAAFNGIQNAGADAAHSDTSATWAAVAGGLALAKNSTATGAALWTDRGLQFDAVKRAMSCALSLSGLTKGFTLDVFGYCATSWGIMATLSQSTTQITEVMPYGDNIGAQINLHRTSNDLYATYCHQTAPSTTGICLTCTSGGDVVIYCDAQPVVTAQRGTEVFDKIKTATLLTVGGYQTTSDYMPNGSALYGLTVYADALTPQEVASLYTANVTHYLAA